MFNQTVHGYLLSTERIGMKRSMMGGACKSSRCAAACTPASEQHALGHTTRAQVEALLVRACQGWDKRGDATGFDAFELADACGGTPLAALGYWVLAGSGCIRELGLSPLTLMRCGALLEAGTWLYGQG
jgi:hypothetical protein